MRVPGRVRRLEVTQVHHLALRVPVHHPPTLLALDPNPTLLLPARDMPGRDKDLDERGAASVR